MNTEVEDIKARLSVREVIGGYVQLTKAGVSWKGLCPFHHEKSPSFIVNEERASWHCFGCNKGGDIFSFVMEMDGLSFPEALSLLAERAGVVLEKRGRRFAGSSTSDVFSGAMSGTGEIDRAGLPASLREALRAGVAKERVFKMLDLSSKFFEKQLWDGEGKKKALPYLRDRGISDESIRAFRLGYALPGWRTLSDFLTSKGFTLHEIEAGGMAIRKQSTDNLQLTTYNLQPTTNNEQLKVDDPARIATRSVAGGYDRFRDRVTFPVLDTVGRVIGFSARVLPGADEASAKYINTPETIIYHKSRVLYGMYPARQAIREKGYALFVEGNMDVIAMHQVGFTNTIAVSGTALTEEQLRIVKRYTETLRLFFDMDSAGQKAARKSAEMAIGLGFSVSIVSLPLGKDAAEMARENVEALHKAVEHSIPAPEYFLNASLAEHDVRAAEGKRRIAEDFLKLVRLIPQHIEQAHWVHALADRIGVAEKTLLVLLKTMKAPLAFPSSRESLPDMQDESSSESSSVNVSFETPSEKLGRDIASLLLAFPILLPLPLEGVSERVFSFIAKMPLLAFLAGETPETFSFVKLPEELKEEAAELAFHGEKMLRLPEQIEDADREKARMFFDTTWKHLTETLRKEEMETLERAMRAARERGDKEEEKRLAGELVRVGGEKEANGY
jgi:DNA primase